MSELASSNPRSSFVTIVAWIFIVLSGFTTLIGVLQNIMVYSMFAHPNHGEWHVPPDANVPASFAFMTNHIQLFFALFLLVSATTLVSSFGLLKRKNRARLAFIGIMTTGIVWNVGGLFVMGNMLSSFPSQGTTALPGANMETFKNMIVGFNIAFALGVSGLFVWIIKRLTSVDVREEFT